MNTIILDFYGLPGCGKSTVSHLLANELKKRGVSTLEPSFDFVHGKIKSYRKICKLYNSAIFTIRYPILANRVRKIIISNRHTKWTAFILQYINIVFKYMLIKKNMGKYTVLIFDEGVAQDAIGLSVNEYCKDFYSGVESGDNLKALWNILATSNTVCFIELQEDMIRSLDRISKRKKEGSRIEKINKDEHKKKIMDLFFSGCNSINSSLNSLNCNQIHVDKSEKSLDTEAKVKIILSRLNNYYRFYEDL